MMLRITTASAGASISIEVARTKSTAAIVKFATALVFEPAAAAYRRYAKATELRALGATRKRHAHRLMTASMEEKVAPKAER